MATLTVLHGTFGVAILCGLILAEEAGVPMPFAPGDMLLVIGGMLVAAGEVSAWLLVPSLALASITGALLGYGWSRALGARRLTALADRLHARHHLDRIERRLRGTGSAGIAVLRLLPGLRIYTTLAVGALRLDLRTYVGGLVPSVVIWVGGFTTLGMVAGAQVERLLSSVDHDATVVGLAALAVAGVVGGVVLHRQHRRAACAA